MPIDRTQIRQRFREAFKRRNRKVNVVSALKSLGDFGTQLTQEKFKRDAEERAEKRRQAEIEQRFGQQKELTQLSSDLTTQRQREAFKAARDAYGEQADQALDLANSGDPEKIAEAIRVARAIPPDAAEVLGVDIKDWRAEMKDLRKEARDVQKDEITKEKRDREAKDRADSKQVNALIEEFRNRQASGDMDGAADVYIRLTRDFPGHPDVGAFTKEVTGGVSGRDGVGGRAEGTLSPAGREKAAALVGGLRDPVDIQQGIPEDARGDVTSLATGAALGPVFSGTQDLIPVTATVTDEGFAAVAAYDAKIRSEKDLWEQENFEPGSPHNINDEFNRTRMQQEAENELRLEREASREVQPNFLQKINSELFDDVMEEDKGTRLQRQVSSLMDSLERAGVFKGVTDSAKKKEVAAQMLARNTEQAKAILDPLGLTVREVLNALGFDYAGN